MEDEEWLQRLLKTSRNALEYARSPEADTHVIAGLEEQCKNLERRLANASGRVSPLTRCDECSPLRDE